MTVISLPNLVVISAIITIFGCIDHKQSETLLIQPVIPMKVGDIKEFTLNNLSVIFRKTLSDTFDLSLILLRAVGDEDSTNTDLEELILRVSLRKAQHDTTIHLSNLAGFNALTTQSVTFNLEISLKNLLSVFYNQSFDSLSIDSVRHGRLNSLAVADEDLQRYHADKFVTSRLLLVIEGDYSLDTVQRVSEKSFYGKTIGEYRRKGLTFPENPFISKFRLNELKSD